MSLTWMKKYGKNIVNRRIKMLKVTCPNNPKHNRFSTTAHVMQDWMVDNYGEFVRELNPCVQIDNLPEKGNTFTCMCKTNGKVCGAEAIVEQV